MMNNNIVTALTRYRTFSAIFPFYLCFPWLKIFSDNLSDFSVSVWLSFLRLFFFDNFFLLSWCFLLFFLYFNFNLWLFFEGLFHFRIFPFFHATFRALCLPLIKFAHWLFKDFSTTALNQKL